jgi:hypothetical protein
MSQSVQPDTDRLAALRAKLAARDGTPGFADNARHLREEIAVLESAERQDAIQRPA